MSDKFLDGWCFDCQKELTTDCVAGEHNYQKAVTEEQWVALATSAVEAENASLKARMREAQLKLDGGNDCFDSLEEVVEAAVRGRGEVYDALSKLSKLLKVNADWKRIIQAVEAQAKTIAYLRKGLDVRTYATAEEFLDDYNLEAQAVRIRELEAENGRLSERAIVAAKEIIASATGGCQICSGPHDFDTSVPSVIWNQIIRAKGLPDYLCTTCIIREFVRANQGFTATLWNEEFNGLPIEVIVNGQNAQDATAIQEENNRLRCRIRELDEVAHIAQAVLTALNVGDVQSGSKLHLKLREVMIAYRAALKPKEGK